MIGFRPSAAYRTRFLLVFALTLGLAAVLLESCPQLLVLRGLRHLRQRMGGRHERPGISA